MYSLIHTQERDFKNLRLQCRDNDPDEEMVPMCRSEKIKNQVKETVRLSTYSVANLAGFKSGGRQKLVVG